MSSQLTFEKRIDIVILKVRTGTAITPIYLIIERASSYLNINFFAEKYPIKINSATGRKEFIRSSNNDFSHRFALLDLILGPFF